MASKTPSKKLSKSPDGSTDPVPAPQPAAPVKLSDLVANPELRYKVRVLLHDLLNMATDRAAESRTLATTDALYISEPYFSASEAAALKWALASPPGSAAAARGEDGPVTVEEALTASLRGFFDKRRAGGDARPCGPHDLGPVYLAVFGVAQGELREERFLSRLRRAGLPPLGDGIEGGRAVTKGGDGGKGGERKG